MNGFKRPVVDKATFSTHQAGSRAFAVFGCDPEMGENLLPQNYCDPETLRIA